MEYQEITDYLHGMANPDRAAHSQRFFKTGAGEYGYGDKFLGIRMPVLRQAARRFRGAPLGVAKQLVQSEYHEIRLFALILLVARFATAKVEEQADIYHFYLGHTRYVNNWDLVDGSAHHIVGAYLEGKDHSILAKLAHSESLWERRIAILATYYFIKKNHFDPTMQMAELLVGDQEDLIHKAVGWMLREVGKRDLAIEVAFLDRHYRTMPRTMLRYAIERLSPEQRQHYMH